jgi:hypothetical protein
MGTEIEVAASAERAESEPVPSEPPATPSHPWSRGEWSPGRSARERFPVEGVCSAP